MPIKKGTDVAADPEAFAGAEPLTRYRVVGTHKDGSYDLAVAGQLVATHVHPKYLIVIK